MSRCVPPLAPRNGLTDKPVCGCTNLPRQLGRMRTNLIEGMARNGIASGTFTLLAGVSAAIGSPAKATALPRFWLP